MEGRSGERKGEKIKLERNYVTMTGLSRRGRTKAGINFGGSTHFANLPKYDECGLCRKVQSYPTL